MKKRQCMKPFIILLTILCLLLSPFPSHTFARDSLKAPMDVKTKRNNSEITKGQSSKSSSSSQSKEHATPEENTVVDSEFSEYPKSFVVPKGVCETDKEPSMVIEK